MALESFTYFMVRVRRPPGERAPGLVGVIERVGTGEKREFETSDELVRTMLAWSCADVGK